MAGLSYKDYRSRIFRDRCGHMADYFPLVCRESVIICPPLAGATALILAILATVPVKNIMYLTSCNAI